MLYQEESRIAQEVLRHLATQQAPRGLAVPSDVQGARVDISGVGYGVHRHGGDLRFSQQTDLRRGEIGRFLIVSIGGHVGGWMIASAIRPPGGSYDEHSTEAARRIVEGALADLGYDVGTPGKEGRAKTKTELDAEIRRFMLEEQRPPTRAHQVTPPRREATRPLATRVLSDPPSRTGGILTQREMDAVLRVLSALRRPQPASVLLSWDADMQDALRRLGRMRYVKTSPAYDGRRPKPSAPFRPDVLQTTPLGLEYLESIRSTREAQRRVGRTA